MVRNITWRQTDVFADGNLEMSNGGVPSPEISSGCVADGRGVT